MFKSSRKEVIETTKYRSHRLVGLRRATHNHVTTTLTTGNYQHSLAADASHQTITHINITVAALCLLTRRPLNILKLINTQNTVRPALSPYRSNYGVITRPFNAGSVSAAPPRYNLVTPYPALFAADAADNVGQ
ncbi:hypothetical protein J6590_071387 [Homalodisca vitripennis]|nr:hypothetical protein J6590_071387 [Homalodisca vitripennis]